MNGPLGPDGRSLIVAVDHPLYSWPCAGLEDRGAVLRAVSAAGADAIICSYGTLRDLRESFGAAAPILKLDLTTVAVGGHYPVSEYALAYRVEDAQRLGAAAVLTYVQLGTLLRARGASHGRGRGCPSRRGRTPLCLRDHAG